MTISSQARTAGPFACNGSTTVFPFAFKVFSASDVAVVLRTDATGVETTLVLTVDYTVSLNANQDTNPGGSVTTVGAYAAGITLTLTSKVQYLQPTDLTNQGGFYPKVITTALDRLTIFSQQLLNIATRSLRFPISDGNLDGTLPGKDQRKGKVLAFHETTGLPVSGPSIADTSTVAGNTAAIATVAANIADVNTVADYAVDVANFNATYQGAKAADPTTRNDGSPLQEGDLYFNTNTDRLRVFTGSSWSEGNAGSVAVQRFTGDGTTVSFQLNTAPDNENVVQVFIGGVYQSKTEYDLTGAGSDILTFTAAPPAGAAIEVVTFSVLPLGVVDASQVRMPGGGTLDQAGVVEGNAGKRHFTIGAIPRCNSSGVFELINDSVHNPLNVTSVTQPDQYTIRINYAKTATKINSFIAAPDAELAPFGVVCGGDVGTSYANIQAYAPLNFIADNNSPNPSIVLNDLWAPSIATGSMTAVRVNSSTLRVTHPPTFNNEAPAVTLVNANNLFDFVASYGPTQIDVLCVGDAAGYVSYSGSTWSQAFSPNASAPTLTWTAGNTLRVDHNQSYNSLVVPQVTGHGGGVIPQVTNIGATFFEVSFYDYAGVKITSQSAAMQFWYRLNLRVPCAWPSGNIVSVQRGMVRVPSYNFKGVTGNNLWVCGTFEE